MDTYDIGAGLLTGLYRGIGSYQDAAREKSRLDREELSATLQREKEEAKEKQRLHEREEDAKRREKEREEDNARKDADDVRGLITAGFVPVRGADGKIDYVATSKNINKGFLSAKAQAGTSPVEALLKQYQTDKAKADVERDNLLKEGPKSEGYSRKDKFPLSEGETKDIRSMNISHKNFKALMDSVKNRVKNASKKELLNPTSNARKEIEKDLTNLQLLYKSEDFAKLGVLTGPDLQILEKAIENPSYLDMATDGTMFQTGGGKEGYLQRLGQAQDTVNKKRGATLNEYGYVEEPGLIAPPPPPPGSKEVVGGLIQGAAPPQAEAAPNPPKPGDVDGGYVFKGGNPADPNSWQKVQ